MKRWLCVLLMLSMLFSAAVAEGEETRLTDFVTALMGGEEDDALYARFDEAMRAAISREDFGRLWRQVSLLSGSFVGYAGPTEVTTVNGYTVLTQAMDMTGLDLQCVLSLNADGSIAGLSFTIHRLPEATGAPAGVIEEEVTVGEEPWELPGTLILPEHAERVPAVVLVHGSGPSDRDESVGAVKPFRDIANALAARGVAVLRYDKRTYVYGAEIAASPDYASFTVEEETIQDALAAGRLLANDARIDPNRVFVLGHSLGAMLAPRIVSESDGLFAGMILASGTNKTLLDILLRQTEDGGASATDMTALRRQTEAIAGMTAEEAEATPFLGASAYYFWEMAQHPAAAELLETLALPTLIINGSRDFQVTEAEGREAWEAALSPDEPWLTCLWTDVNHLLMRPEPATGTAEEYMTPCAVAEDVLDAIVHFILNTEETP